MDLDTILSKDCVVPCAKVTSKRQLLQLAADVAAKKLGIDAHIVFETLTGREQCGSTGLGGGIAIPHGKIEGLKGVLGLFIRLERPIEFDSVDDQPVDLAFVLLAPVGAGADHLKALSRVARALREDNLVGQLRQTRDADALHDILCRSPLAHNAA